MVLKGQLVQTMQSVLAKEGTNLQFSSADKVSACGNSLTNCSCANLGSDENIAGDRRLCKEIKIRVATMTHIMP